MSTYNGTTGNDTYTGTTGADLIYGHMGDDTLNGNGGADTIYGGQNNDHITASGLIYGNLGDDVITGFAGQNATIYGGQGNDIINGSSASQAIIYGNRGDDTLNAGSGANTLYGGMGNDTVVVGSGSLTANGGIGQNTLVFSGPMSNYTETQNADGTTTFHDKTGAQGDVTETNFQTVEFTRTVSNGGGGGTTPAPVMVSATSDSFANLPANESNNGNYFFGDGTTPAQGIALTTQNQGPNASTGISVQPRQELNADAYTPTDVITNGTVQTVNYSVPSGTESTANDSQGNNPNRDAVNFDLSVGVGGESIADFLTGGGSFNLSIQGPGGALQTFTAQSAPTQADPNHINFVGTGNTMGSITDFAGNANHVDNSEQFDFFGANHAAPGNTGTVNLDAFNKAGMEVAGTHATLNFV